MAKTISDQFGVSADAAWHIIAAETELRSAAINWIKAQPLETVRDIASRHVSSALGEFLGKAESVLRDELNDGWWDPSPNQHCRSRGCCEYAPPPGGTETAKQPIPSSLRWKIWERDDFTCQGCGVRQRLTIDHIIPESAGGTLDPENLQTLCKSCNSAKGSKTPEEWQEFLNGA